MYKILVVDDENKSRNHLADIISEICPDASVTQVCEAREALQLLRESAFDLLFADIVMPQIDGLEMISRLQKDRRLPYTVLVSAHSEFEYARQALTLGASGYILKPFSHKQVAEAINKYQDKQQAETKEAEGKIVLLSTYDGVYPVRPEDITAIIKEDRSRLTVYTRDACKKMTRGTLSDMFKQIPESFFYVNRQCIVNRIAIKQFNPKSRIITFYGNKTEIELSCSRDCIREISRWFDEQG